MYYVLRCVCVRSRSERGNVTIGTNPIISFPTDDHPSPGQTASHGAGRASSLPNSSLLYILSSGSLNWNYVHYHRDIRISERAETKASGFEACGAQVEEYQCFLSCTSRAAKTCHLQCPTTATSTNTNSADLSHWRV